MEEALLSGFSQKQLQDLSDEVRSALGEEFLSSRKEHQRERDKLSPPMAIHSANPGLTQKDAINDAPGPTLNGLLRAHTSISTNVMPIAIVGISCRFPGGINDPQEMWRVCSAGHSAWSEIPKSRFNGDAFYHPNPERGNSMNVKSGHFLQEDQYGYFDASFFNISPNEARAMDPRCRMHLESAYEALENAGLPIAELAGSETSVFVGAFHEDYSKLMDRDPNTIPMYKATGVGASMLSNRISHWFDWSGPSITLDTACSASTAALHMACDSLRTGSSKIALVSGANLMLEPNLMMALSSLNFLSPDGKTYMFDQRANGYARGEGIGTLVLRPLADAVDSNDSVHAIIRNTGMNQDGRTPGITMPSMKAQQSLIEDTYRQAGIDVSETDFFEAHGTGTQAGDKTEAEALSNALRTSARDPARPLYVGSVKSLMGHCEGASGVAGVIHSTLALKAQCLPPNCNFETPSDQINFLNLNIKVPTTSEYWNCNHPRRVSINSFGYGGTNVHAILEEAQARKQSLNGHGSSSIHPLQRKILFLSANEEESLQRLAKNVANYLANRKDPETFHNLIYTFGQRRSLLRCRFALPTSGIQHLVDAVKSTELKSTRITKNPRICFVFTGQGAQWAGMGCELLSNYPVYQATIHAASKAIADQGATWSLLDQLQDRKTSKINEAYLSQPLCTALQIGLVALLRSWGVNPVSVVGHSSGEIAAAYCAGILSLESAMQVAYFRGKLSMALEVMQKDQHGRMMAVGLSQEEVQSHLLVLQTGRATVACINSPKSVTISGDATALNELKANLDDRGVFNRMLRVNVAYHSHHMKLIASKYAESLADLMISKSNPGIKFHSTVYPGIPLETNAEYWVQNMLSPVQFNDAIQKINSLQSNDSLRIDSFVELGPHSALAGPLKQICASLLPTLRPAYYPSIQRNISDLTSMHELISSLFAHGVKLDAGEVNFPIPHRDLQVLTDLPPYPWNHATRYWHQGRLAGNYLNRSFPPHDLLGIMTDDSSDLDMRWTNQLRLSDLPWLREHTLMSEAIFPGAGYIAMAIEAARQKSVITGDPVHNFVLREISFSVALIIPETSEGIEISLLLEPLRDSSLTSSRFWNTFRLLSFSGDRRATEHCRGLISTSQQPSAVTPDSELQSISENSDGSVEDTKSYKQMLDKFSDTGVRLGDTFRLLSDCSLDSNLVTCNLRIPDTRSSMPFQHESLQVVTAPVLDASLQVSILALNGLVDTFPGPLLPTFVGELYVSKDIVNEENHIFRAQGKTTVLSPREFSGDACLFDLRSSRLAPVLSVKGCKFTFATGSKGNLEKDSGEDKERCWNMHWKPDVTFFNQSMVESQWGVSHMDAEELARNSLCEKTAYFSLRLTLDALSDSECEKMLPHHQYFLRWARHRVEEGKSGHLNYQTAEWHTDDQEVIQSTLKQASESCAPERMTAQVGSRLADVLRQKIDPLSLMMENDLLDQYYADLRFQDRAYSSVAKYLDLLAHQWPNIRILEIGAGTGSATAFALKALGGEKGGHFRCSSYHFTDISAGFFEKARRNFSAWESFLQFKTLDIEDDPQAQGFESEGFDLIVAANVLHATAKMESTMKNVHNLLKPGGKLVLVEVTNTARLSSAMVLTFGLLPGWWRGAAEGRDKGPLLSEDDWQNLLQRTGFTGLDICVRDTADSEKYILSTMVTSKREETTSLHSDDVAIIYASDSTLDLAQQLGIALQKPSCEGVSRISNVEQSQASEMYYVLLDDRNGSVLANLSDEQLQALQALLAAAKGLLWVTFDGLTSCVNAKAGLVPGFVRALRTEYGNVKCVTLDLQSQHATSSSGAVSRILSLLHVCFTDSITGAMASDLEYAEKEGQLLIPRLTADGAANEAVHGEPRVPEPETQPLWQRHNPLTLEMRSTGLLDSFQFVSDPRMENSNNIDDEEVEVEIKCAALNFHDLMVAQGQLPDLDGYGLECSGLVTKVGCAVDKSLVGRRVCAMASRCFGTHTRTSKDLICELPDDMSFEVAASIPSVFSTSYYSLYHAARLQAGETVLIHSAAGGIGQACIKLALLIGATVFVTVGTPAKIGFLEERYGLPRKHILHSRDLSFGPKLMALTKGKGVDVIVNSLAGDALRESWRCIAMFGRFIDLGKKDAIENAHIGMAPFEKSVSFIAVGFDLYGAFKPAVAGDILRTVIDMFARKKLTPVEPLNVYSMSNIEKAFRLMQSGNHMGKIVINAAENCSVPVVPKPCAGLKLRSDASYLIVGGLTGIGAAFAKYMTSRWAAKHLILLSRSGLKANHASDLVASLQQEGASVKVLACDVANREQLEAALRDCADTCPPIRGVIQGAMVLQDSIFAKMTLDRYHGALNPKLHGSQNLHDYFFSRSHHLDFFVMLSSLAGVNGNSSQANYAAGNTYQDALAHHRVSTGLPALAIDVGAVTDAGWTADNWDILTKGVGLAWAQSITTEHLLRLIEHNILTFMPGGLSAAPPQVAIGIDETRPWDARFAHIVASKMRSPTQQLSAKEHVSLPDRMAAAGSDRELLYAAIFEAFSRKLASLLDSALDDIHADDTLAGHGVDSLVAVEIRNWLGKEAGANVPMSDVLNGQKTIVQMVWGIVGSRLRGL
ncbi:MAG: hypothetical protein Q9195_009094 [Heterodermia aff. obscurata]